MQGVSHSIKHLSAAIHEADNDHSTATAARAGLGEERARNVDRQAHIARQCAELATAAGVSASSMTSLGAAINARLATQQENLRLVTATMAAQVR